MINQNRYCECVMLLPESESMYNYISCSLLFNEGAEFLLALALIILLLFFIFNKIILNK